MRADFFFCPDLPQQESRPEAFTDEYQDYIGRIVASISSSPLPVLLHDPRLGEDGVDRTSGYKSDVFTLFPEEARIRTGEVFHDERYVSTPFISISSLIKFMDLLRKAEIDKATLHGCYYGQRTGLTGSGIQLHGILKRDELLFSSLSDDINARSGARVKELELDGDFDDGTVRFGGTFALPGEIIVQPKYPNILDRIGGTTPNLAYQQMTDRDVTVVYQPNPEELS